MGQNRELGELGQFVTIQFSPNTVTLTSNNLAVNGTITANGGVGTAGQFLTSGASGNVYWTTATPTVNQSAQYTWSNTHSFSAVVTHTANLAVNGAINANGGVGTAGQFLTSGASGNVYWTTATPTVNQTAQYAWTNTHSFSSPVTYTANLAVNGAIVANGGVGTAGQFLTSGASGNVYWTTATPTVNQTAQYAWTNTHSFSAVVTHTANISVNGAITANGGVGTAGQFLTSGASGNVYWTTATPTVNQTAQYAWTNTHSFSLPVTHTNTIILTANLTVNGAVTANGGLGTAGQVLTSGATGNVYWTTATATVNQTSQYAWTNTHSFSLPVTHTNTIILTANLTVNGAVTANGGLGTAGQVLTSGATGNVYWSTAASGTVNVAAQYAWTNTHSFSSVVTHTANLAVNGAITANGSVGTAGQFLTSGASGNVYWTTATPTVNQTAQYAWTNTHSFSLPVTHTNTIILTANLTVNGAVTANGGLGTAGQVLTSGASGNVYWATAASGTVNVAAQYAWTNTHSFSLPVTHTNTIILTANLTVNGAITANGSVGTAGQVLTSGATGNVYWTTATATVNQAAQYAWTNTHSFSANVSLNKAITANGGVGTAGQVLSSGASGNVYWSSTPLVRAWVRFTVSAGAVSGISSSFNVASVTRASAGAFTITFTNAMSSAAYAILITAVAATTQTSINNQWQNTTTTSFLAQHFENAVATDPSEMCVVVFGPT